MPAAGAIEPAAAPPPSLTAVLARANIGMMKKQERGESHAIMLRRWVRHAWNGRATSM